MFPGACKANAGGRHPGSLSKSHFQSLLVVGGQRFEKHSEAALWLKRTARQLPDWILPPEGGVSSRSPCLRDQSTCMMSLRHTRQILFSELTASRRLPGHCTKVSECFREDGDLFSSCIFTKLWANKGTTGCMPPSPAWIRNQPAKCALQHQNTLKSLLF